MTVKVVEGARHKWRYPYYLVVEYLEGKVSIYVGVDATGKLKAEKVATAVIELELSYEIIRRLGTGKETIEALLNWEHLVVTEAKSERVVIGHMPRYLGTSHQLGFGQNHPPRSVYSETESTPIYRRQNTSAQVAGCDVKSYQVAVFQEFAAWCEARKSAVFARRSQIVEETARLEEGQALGEIILNFGGHYRVMGATNNVQFWVIRPDGSLREPDEEEGRGHNQQYKGSEGNKRWDIVAPEELAICWSKSFTAAPHQFTVNKSPVAGCTPNQLTTVKRIEREISERFYGATGCSGRMSPSIANGWDLVGANETLTEKEFTKPVAEGGEGASGEQIHSLLDKFKK